MNTKHSFMWNCDCSVCLPKRLKITKLRDKIKDIESQNLPNDEELESLKEDLEVLENN